MNVKESNTSYIIASIYKKIQNLNLFYIITRLRF